jgi:hypothetical protein
MTHPPKSLQGLLWSTDVHLLDIDRNKGYIIHQVLIYGTMTELGWLFQTYSAKVIIDVFVNRPAKLYPKDVYYFVKNFLLSLRHVPLDSNAYVTSIHGPIRQRTADSFS